MEGELYSVLIALNGIFQVFFVPWQDRSLSLREALGTLRFVSQTVEEFSGRSSGNA